jgi:hypothetical protein
MTMMSKFLIGGAGLAALAAAAPSAAQYGYAYPRGYSNYGYSQSYGYAQPYGYGQAYGYGANSQVATQRCTAAVQNRLYNRSGIGGILGAVLGAGTTGRVVAETDVRARGNGMVRVRGLASSGRMAYNNYGPYGAGAYGALGYGYANAADLSFRCDVDYRGFVRNVDINRR